MVWSKAFSGTSQDIWLCVLCWSRSEKGKLDQKTNIFLGYDSNSKGYRIYNPLTTKILISRNMKFDKFSKWNWEKYELEASSKGKWKR